MADFTSAESITRALRAKDARPDAVAQTAASLLAGTISVYLPNSAHFVFDLVCDRMNDLTSKNFGSWKRSPALWRLWQSSWDSLGGNDHDVEYRAKSFTRVRILPVVSATLDHVAQEALNSNPESLENLEDLLKVMFTCLDTFMSSGYIDVDEFSTVGLLSSYCQVLENMPPLQLGQIDTEAFTNTIGTIYRLPHQSVNYKPSKKSMAKFFAEVFPSLLVIFTHRKENLPTASYETLHGIFVQTSFEVESSSLASHIDTLLKSPPTSLDDACIEFFFHQVIYYLASKDIASCEAIYVKLTAGQFAHMAEQLLSILSKVNKTLSPGFFAEIYQTEVAKPIVNWKLVSYVLNLDSTMATEKWKTVLDGSKAVSESDKLLIIKNIAGGFVRARDFPLFVKEVYPHATTVSKVYESENVMDALAPKVPEMSANQIRTLVSVFLQNKSMKPMSLLARGLLFCSNTTQKALENSFTDYSFCHRGWAEVAFFVLCVYGQKIVSPEILTKTLENKTASTPYELELVLRVSELTKNTDHVTAKMLEKFIKKANKDEILQFAERWMVLLARFPEVYPTLLDGLFTKASQNEVLGFFGTYEVVIFEIRPFLTALSEYLQKHEIEYKYDLYRLIPPTVIRRFFSHQVNSLVEQCQKSPKDTAARNTLKHVLKEPVLSSAIERDFATLYAFVDSATPESLDDTMEICSKIWSRHLQTIKDKFSAEFVATSAEKLEKKFKKPKEADLHFARVIFASDTEKLPEDFGKLLEKYVEVVCKRLVSDSSVANIQALSGLPLTESATKVVQTAIKETGNKDLEPAAQAQLFQLTTEVSPNTQYLYVVSLFVALYDKVGCEHHESAIASLKAYLARLTPEQYLAVFHHCVSSLESEFISPLLETVAVLASLISSTHKDEHTRVLMESLSAVSLHIGSVSNSKVVVRLAGTFTALLSSHMWAYKQYTVELTMGLVDQVVAMTDRFKSVEIYFAAVNLLSQIVLFHRFRFSSRYHLVVKILSNLMMPLTSGQVGDNAACGAAYRRLVIALCEPREQGATRDSENLTSQAAFYKTALRKHAHILLVNYIYYRLTFGFSDEITENLNQAINSVFTLLSSSELSLVVQCLDSTGKTLFQSLYSTYKEHGKWRE